MSRLIVRTMLAGITVVVLGYLAVIAFYYARQRSFQYQPDAPIVALSETNLTQAQQVSIETGDGEVIHGWYQPPTGSNPVIAFYKGNLGTFSGEHERYEAFVADGFGFLAFDYRGFPMSPGTISQTHILQDALAAYDWLAAKGDPIVVWGRSLGSGPATFVASKRSPEALLLETPFLSAVDVGQARYPFIPVAWLTKDPFPVKTWIRDVRAPVFVAHGTADTSIDVSNGKAVFALASDKYELWLVEGADHGDLWARGIWQKARSFFLAAQARAHPK